jgi:hypothetical protein
MSDHVGPHMFDPATYRRPVGHARTGFCEECWREAATLYAIGGYESHADAYQAVLRARSAGRVLVAAGKEEAT